MVDAQSTPEHDPVALREDMGAEYHALLQVVNEFDQRAITIKGWSVTLSLAGLGLGFQQGHYYLFALGSATALGFWLVEAMAKGHQLRYYSRMRDIEVAAFHLNNVALSELGHASSPRIDMYWSFRGFSQRKLTQTRRRMTMHLGKHAPEPRDWRTEKPERLTPEEIDRLVRRSYWMPHVLLPHWVAVTLGLLLFVCAVANVPAFEKLNP